MDPLGTPPGRREPSEDSFCLTVTDGYPPRVRPGGAPSVFVRQKPRVCERSPWHASEGEERSARGGSARQRSGPAPRRGHELPWGGVATPPLRFTHRGQETVNGKQRSEVCLVGVSATRGGGEGTASGGRPGEHGRCCRTLAACDPGGERGAGPCVALRALGPAGDGRSASDLGTGGPGSAAQPAGCAPLRRALATRCALNQTGHRRAAPFLDTFGITRTTRATAGKPGYVL